MKKYLTISLMFIQLLLHAASADSVYMKASDAYASGNFEQSLLLYESIVVAGLESPELYYNMGNAAFRSNKLGYAVLYFEKALKLDPGYDDARKNLEYVSIYKEDQLEVVPEFFIRSWTKALFQLFSLKTWSYFSLFLFFLMLTGTLVYIFSVRQRIKKAGFFTGITAVLLFFISMSAAINQNSLMIHPENAVITIPSVVVKSSPSLSGTDLFVLHEGTLLKLDDEVGDWIEIKISDGRVGWIPGGSYEII